MIRRKKTSETLQDSWIWSLKPCLSTSPSFNRKHFRRSSYCASVLSVLKAGNDLHYLPLPDSLTSWPSHLYLQPAAWWCPVSASSSSTWSRPKCRVWCFPVSSAVWMWSPGTLWTCWGRSSTQLSYGTLTWNRESVAGTLSKCPIFRHLYIFLPRPRWGSLLSLLIGKKHI